MAAMNILVTGGAGFIGSAVTRELDARGIGSVVLDRSQGFDVTSPNDVMQCAQYADAVIHLAGVLGTAELFATPDRAVDVNIKGTLRVLEACGAFGIPYVGITMPHVWCNVYQATKQAAETLTWAWAERFGFPAAYVRAFNAYGPGQKHGPGHPQKIIPTFATKAWANEPIPIWGDGKQTVDLVHADDLARLLVDAVGLDRVTIDGGTGTELAVLDVARFVCDITGSTAGVEHLPMRDGEIPGTRLAAAGEGWELLGWQPVHDWQRIADAVAAYG